MPYIPHTPEELQEMLSVVGVRDLDGLFADIPPEMRPKQFNLPKGVYPYHMLVCGYPADHIADPEHREARTIPLPNFLLK